MNLSTQPTIVPPQTPFRALPIVAFLRQWLDRVEVNNAKTAHLLCKLIPSACPFERTVSLGSRPFHIPALCKLNPLYDDLIFLRLRALRYLIEECGEEGVQ